MLFFRSEERIASWCRSRGVAPKPIVTMPQLWRMAVTWYGNRLDPDARRPAAEEICGIFESIGLYGDFWDPLSGCAPR